jgi:hypothetical protein
MRLAITIFWVALTATSASAVSPRAREYRHRLVGKRTLIGSAAGAGVNQVRNSPHQWGRGVGGFAKRFGSGVGQHIAKETIQFGVAAAHHENLHYQRSNKHGTLPRMGYAVKHTFIVPKTNKRGKKTVALGRISGNMGAGMISQAWMPAASVGAGAASGGIGLGADVGVNMAREFWPKHKRRARRLHKGK